MEIHPRSMEIGKSTTDQRNQWKFIPNPWKSEIHGNPSRIHEIWGNPTRMYKIHEHPTREIGNHENQEIANPWQFTAGPRIQWKPMPDSRKSLKLNSDPLKSMDIYPRSMATNGNPFQIHGESMEIQPRSTKSMEIHTRSMEIKIPLKSIPDPRTQSKSSTIHGNQKFIQINSRCTKCMEIRTRSTKSNETTQDPYEIHARSMGNPCRIHGNSTPDPREIHARSIGNPSQIQGNPCQMHGKSMSPLETMVYGSYCMSALWLLQLMFRTWGGLVCTRMGYC